MGALQRQKKDSASGKKVNSASTPVKEGVIARVASWLRISDTPRITFKQDNRRLGTLEYRVTIPNNNVFTYGNLKDARAMKKLIKKTGIDSVIIRVDTTDDGFVLSEREIK